MRFQFRNVCLESISYAIPDELVTSEELEARLGPVYSRLGLSVGRLELMTGIRERRLYPAKTLPSDVSTRTAETLLTSSDWDRSQVGALIHASVCRDHLEPATACRVHHMLDLPADCVMYDVSNACLGFLNGIVQVANMIELGQIKSGLIVGTESSRALLETTIASMNNNKNLSRAEMKLAMASLTIGSGSAAILLTHRDLSRTQNRLLGGAALCSSSHFQLCHSGPDEAVAPGMHPNMCTDSETLLRQGVAAAADCFEDFQFVTGWGRKTIEKTFCHQVGIAHKRYLFESLRLPQEIDFSTVETLGNTGSVAVPITFAMGIEHNRLKSGDRVALLGIGSGINVMMLAVNWQCAPATRIVAEHADQSASTPLISIPQPLSK